MCDMHVYCKNLTIFKEKRIFRLKSLIYHQNMARLQRVNLFHHHQVINRILVSYPLKVLHLNRIYKRGFEVTLQDGTLYRHHFEHGRIRINQ